MSIKRSSYKPKTFNKADQIRFDKNEFIKAEKLRVIDNTGENLGVITKTEALNIAREKGVDLVLISPNQDIPVAKIIDWSKFKYEQSKKHKNSKGKNIKSKEWWFSPKIEVRDMEVKLSNIEKAMKKGTNVKIVVKYANRTQYNDMKETMDKVIELSSVFAEPSSEITKEGRNLSILLKLKRNEKQSQNA